MKQHKQFFFKRIGRKKLALNYLLYLPGKYDQTSHNNWPLVIFLHGQGERGDNLDLLLRHGIPRIVEEWDEFPGIVVSPQCPQRTFWVHKIEVLYALIQETIQTYRIDVSRIYLTGISMGGFGAWHLAAAYPNLFAAVVPICGGTEPLAGFPERIKVLKDVPLWVFHGALDKAVPIRFSQKLVDLLQAEHGNVRFTVYPEGSHDVWTQTYHNPDLYTWLFAQKNPKSPL
jgi:predicted peptidase